MILAGDIGGTNTRLAIVAVVEGRVRIVAEETFASREEPSLESALRKFLGKHVFPLERAGLGVAGPVRQGRCEATNLPWIIDSHEIASEFGLSRVGLINDLEAKACGIADLEPEELETLNPGIPDVRGNQAVIAAGTGLGEAVLIWDATEYRPFASEGGHADFAPRNRLEMELLDFLLKRHPRVSVERLVSGQGLLNIYQFLKEKQNVVEQDWLAEQLRQQDPPAVISRNALDGRSPLCMEALDLFTALYGAEAGNLALKVMATGGIYLGGGIAPKIVAKLREPVFMNAFTAKGRMKPLLQAMPVRVILNTGIALIGAARHAMRL
ncbi:MAG: glucokinase [Thermodesulfobacteriota bacterium]